MAASPRSSSADAVSADRAPWPAATSSDVDGSTYKHWSTYDPARNEYWIGSVCGLKSLVGGELGIVAVAVVVVVVVVVVSVAMRRVAIRRSTTQPLALSLPLSLLPDRLSRSNQFVPMMVYFSVLSRVRKRMIWGQRPIWFQYLVPHGARVVSCCAPSLSLPLALTATPRSCIDKKTPSA